MLQPSCEAAVKSRFRSPTLPFAEIYATDDLVQPQQDHHKYIQIILGKSYMQIFSK